MAGYSDGDEVLSGWRIVGKPIGEGAFGRVYEVRKVEHGIEAKSALKVVSVPPSQSIVKTMLSEGQDEASVAAYFGGLADELAREIALLAGLSHPGIVTYHDHAIVQHEDCMGWDVLLRMELLTPLTDFMGGSALPQAEVARLGAEVADALAYCHKRDVIHRDVKPSNIFVDGEGRFKLGDFGVARVADHTMGVLSRKGTEDYMAPEVYRGDSYGPSADVYSLGLVLYQLLNGNRLPFLPGAPAPVGFQDREQARARRLAGETLPAIADCDPGLYGVIANACSPDPGLRPSAVELRGTLERLDLPGDGARIQPRERGYEPGAEVQEACEQDDSSTKGIWDSFEGVARSAADEGARERERLERLERERLEVERERREYEEKQERERQERKERERRARELQERERQRKERMQTEQEDGLIDRINRLEPKDEKQAKKNEAKGKVLGWVAFSLVFLGLWLSCHLEEGELLYTVHQGMFIFFALVAGIVMALVRFAWGKLSSK